MRQPVAQMAREAVDMLITPGTVDAPQAPAGIHRVQPYELVVRDSTCARRNKPETVKARKG